MQKSVFIQTEACVGGRDTADIQSTVIRASDISAIRWQYSNITTMSLRVTLGDGEKSDTDTITVATVPAHNGKPTEPVKQVMQAVETNFRTVHKAAVSDVSGEAGSVFYEVPNLQQPGFNRTEVSPQQAGRPKVGNDPAYRT